MYIYYDTVYALIFAGLNFSGLCIFRIFIFVDDRFCVFTSMVGRLELHLWISCLSLGVDTLHTLDSILIVFLTVVIVMILLLLQLRKLLKQCSCSPKPGLANPG